MIKEALHKQWKDVVEKGLRIYALSSDKNVARIIIEDSFTFIEKRIEPIRILIEDMKFKGNVFSVIKILVNNSPFIMDSITSLFSEYNLRIEFVIHPIFTVERDKRGNIISIKGPLDIGDKELLIYACVNYIPDSVKKEINKKSKKAITESLIAKQDFEKIKQKLKSIVRNLNDPIYLDKTSEKDIEDAKSLLLWLLEGNFLFLGFRSYIITYEQKEVFIQAIKEDALGILGDVEHSKFKEKKNISILPAIAQERIKKEEVFVIDKTNAISNVYRKTRMDYISIARFDKKGKIIGRNVFMGMFMPQALIERASHIPFLKSKLDRVLFEEGIPENSFEHHHITDIFNTLPKEELFVLKTRGLNDVIYRLLTSETEQHVHVFIVPTTSVRGFSLVVVLPYRLYSRTTVDKITNFLEQAFNAVNIEYKTITQSSRIIRLHYYIVSKEKELPDIKRIEKEVQKIAISWQEEFGREIHNYFSRENAPSILKRYAAKFTEEYTSHTTPAEAAFDIEKVEKVFSTKTTEASIYKERKTYFKIYSLSRIPLYEILPILRNLGLTVLYEDFLEIKVEKTVYIQRFSITTGEVKQDKQFFPIIEENFKKTWGKVVEDDALNKLTVKAYLNYKDIDFLRASRNYLLQINQQLSEGFANNVLLKYSKLSLLFAQYFHVRFDSKSLNQEEQSNIRKDIEFILSNIEDVHEYRIVNSLFNIIQNILRTDFFLNKERHYISFKIDSKNITSMPLPKPFYEIYVHSSFMEGVHLRGGKIARGGIRWSDRPSDFRVEIDDLMKTQVLKNSVIVPTGSKGGFIIKRNETSGKEAYKTLIRSMLNITDNYMEGKIVHPENVVCYDEKDPYLVVAADKGTATFSDTANDISKEYNFWLGDAFASGGKYGYDHKKIGITARGAWECVKRHFRELEKNIEKKDISVCGIGDMSGDVFGNFMILSPNLLLKAAFNHKEIFVDPLPDKEKSYAERLRLFKQCLSWEHYDKSLLSKVGFIINRNVKSVNLSKEAKSFLQTDKDELSGEEIIKLILKAKIDLLWNGGIGTYVKASAESQSEVEDRANDSVRVDANELKARVVGEGGNLGFTQKARIEYAMGGGRINTDALDNSGGVDLSDHEVNLKILLHVLMKEGLIKDMNERNELLKNLTEQAILRVIVHNYMQSFSISLDERRAKKEPDIFYELLRYLQREGILSAKEYPLLTRKEYLARLSKNISFTRPELYIVMACMKILIKNSITQRNSIDENIIDKYAISYFPPYIKENFAQIIEKHPLKREIASTYITNLLINNGGSPSLFKIFLSTGVNYTIIVKSLIFMYEVTGLVDVRTKLFEEENKIPQDFIYALCIDMFMSVELMATQEIYLLGKNISIDKKHIEEAKQCFNEFNKKCIGGLFKDAFLDKVDELIKKGLNKDTAADVAKFYFVEYFVSAFNISKLLQKDLKGVVRAITEIRETFFISKIIENVKSIPITNEWDRRAQLWMIKNYLLACSTLTMKAVKEFDGDVQKLVDSRKEEYEILARKFASLRGISIENLHPFVLLYDTLQAILR